MRRRIAMSKQATPEFKEALHAWRKKVRLKHALAADEEVVAGLTILADLEKRDAQPAPSTVKDIEKLVECVR